MNYVKMFESFFSEYSNKIEKIKKGFTDDISTFLHEVTDDFPNFEMSILDGSFFIKFFIEYNDSKKFLEVFHEGLFNRIVDEYPGTEIIYGFEVTYGNSSIAIPLKHRWRATHNSAVFADISEGINKFIKKQESTKLRNPDSFTIKVWIK